MLYFEGMQIDYIWCTFKRLFDILRFKENTLHCTKKSRTKISAIVFTIWHSGFGAQTHGENKLFNFVNLVVKRCRVDFSFVIVAKLRRNFSSTILLLWDTTK